MIHDTFAREITVYQEAEKVLISTDPNFNPIFRRSSSNIQVTPKKSTIIARILYGKDQEVDSVNGIGVDFQTKVSLPIGWVRLKVGKDGYEILKDCKRIEFDGRTFAPLSSNRPHGLFEIDYYTFLLQPIQPEE